MRKCRRHGEQFASHTPRQAIAHDRGRRVLQQGLARRQSRAAKPLRSQEPRARARVASPRRNPSASTPARRLSWRGRPATARRSLQRGSSCAPALRCGDWPTTARISPRAIQRADPRAHPISCGNFRSSIMSKRQAQITTLGLRWFPPFHLIRTSRNPHEQGYAEPIRH